jgi:putative nucleotidyltransferase with HDIG domain
MPKEQAEIKRYIAEKIERGDDLPVFPKASHQALSLIKREDVGIPQLAKVVLLDSALASNILRVANSPFYNVQRMFTKVNEAIAYIGLEETKHIIYSAYCRTLFGRGQSAKTWRHSIAAAFSAEEIAKACHIDADEAYLAGLLHDVGKTFLQSKIVPQYYSIMASLENTQEKDKVMASEQHAWGYDHAQIGEMLLLRWNFDAHLAAAIGQHHNPEQPNDALSQCVALANQIAHQFDIPTPARTTQLNPVTLTHIPVDSQKINLAVQQAQERIDSFLEKVSILAA